MTHTETLRALADEIAATLPGEAARLHALANRIGPMEDLLDEMVAEAMADEYRLLLENRGVVILPVGVWGRA